MQEAEAEPQEEIKISFTHGKGKQLGIIGILLALGGGAGAYIGQDKSENPLVANVANERLSVVEEKVKGIDKNLDRVFNKLDHLESGQHEILLLLKKQQ